MVKTSSTMLPLGSLMPDFDLPLVKVQESIKQEKLLSESMDRLNSNMFGSNPVLFLILCAHCPFVKHIESAITNLYNDFASDIDFIAVSSNSLATHPEDGPEFLAEQIARNGWNFPYLLDLDQTLAKSLKAACTPDFFLFTSGVKDNPTLIYRGQFDESRPTNNIPPNGADLRGAFEAVLNFKEVPFIQKPSIGCNIKWNPGFEPVWFN